MDDKLTTWATASTVMVLTIVGIVDAIRDGDTGAAVLLALILVGVAALARTRTRTGAVILRRDLASWLERTSPVTGESPHELGNLAVSRLRAGFWPVRDEAE